jgi:hypothetical protein
VYQNIRAIKSWCWKKTIRCNALAEVRHDRPLRRCEKLSATASSRSRLSLDSFVGSAINEPRALVSSAGVSLFARVLTAVAQKRLLISRVLPSRVREQAECNANLCKFALAAFAEAA